MRVLLTGCAGFIGARVGEMLLQRGDDVVGIDNLNDYYDARLKHYRLERLRALTGFTFHEADIEDSPQLAGIFARHRFDAVINLAARAGVRSSIIQPRVYLTTNTLGTLNVLELIAEHGIGRFVMASTSSLYAGAAMPFLETSDVTRPISPYAATKLAAEALARTWNHLHGINVAILRYFTVYGPAGRPDMSPFRFAEWIRRGQSIQLYGDGRQTRDFTYIDDIAAGTLAALEVRGCEVFNLGGGNRPVSINAMVAALEQGMGSKAMIEYLPPNPVDMADTSADISKARKVLGWNPVVAPEEGFRRMAEWHLANAEWLDSVSL
jgi:nucleoside-diphosphate-sugar epimerase